jgi:hypothetical protein
MEKAELRANLKNLQLIVHNRADEDLPQVVEELSEAVEKVKRALEKRSERKGYDRKERGGHDRKE